MRKHYYLVRNDGVRADMNAARPCPIDQRRQSNLGAGVNIHPPEPRLDEALKSGIEAVEGRTPQGSSAGHGNT